MQNTELRFRVRPGGSVGGRRRDDLHARSSGIRYDADRCRRNVCRRPWGSFFSILLFLRYFHFPPSNELLHFLLIHFQAIRQLLVAIRSS